MYTFWNWEGGSESCFYCWVWKPLLSFDIFCCGFAIDFLILWLFRMWIWVCPCVGHAWRLWTTFGTFQFSFEAGSLLGPRTSSRPGWLVHARASRKPPVSAFHLTVSGITGRWDYMLSFCVGCRGLNSSAHIHELSVINWSISSLHQQLLICRYLTPAIIALLNQDAGGGPGHRSFNKHSSSC